ncbi:MAG TPA: CRISPR-associated helicase Cas3', partial [Candidatus Sulfotelmatobacter sp.]
MCSSLTKFIAHHRTSGEDQSLSSHLAEVASLASLFAGKIGLPNAGELVGLLHDLGKYSAAFQNYLKSAVGYLEQDKDDDFIDPERMKGKIDHSTAGAQAIFREFKKRGQIDRIAGEILAVCICSHHSGLIDCLGSDGSDLLTRRLEKADAFTHLGEAWSRAESAILSRYEHLTGSQNVSSEIRGIINDLCRKREGETIVRFKVGLLARFLFSCLIDADRISTADFEYPNRGKHRLLGRYEDWLVLSGRLERHLSSLTVDSRINRLRRTISDHCLAAAERERGIFTLTVPTGGGKTLAGLRFALRHAELHQMDRVIFVVPYTSIIDQNAKTVRNILEAPEETVTPGSIVLEHHSNLLPEQQTWRNKLLTENWDAPVVFTTTVQLLETLFGGGTRSARRMHQLSKAILVFDEIQTLPLKCVHMFNNAMNFLVEQCGTTVVLCTATQPLLGQVDATKGAIQITDGSEIMPDVANLFVDLARVEVVDRRKPGGWNDEDVADFALQEVRTSGSCLVVVNTKAAAHVLYQLCRNSSPNLPIFHLSANMCPAHRKEVLTKLVKLLSPDSESAVLCISTQVIEAGVDVDFGSVIRFTAGLDSIAQAAGRCNRHGERVSGRVSIVNAARDTSEMIQDIRIGRQVAERVFSELAARPTQRKDKLLSPEAMDLYFNYYFFERRKEMSYPVGPEQHERNDTLLNLLSANTMAADGDTPPNYFRQSFKTASRLFTSIDAPTQGVVVPYGPGAGLIADLCAAVEVEKQFDLLHRAQQFSVNVFPSVLIGLQAQSALHEVQEGTGILHLDSRFYDAELGL